LIPPLSTTPLRLKLITSPTHTGFGWTEIVPSDSDPFVTHPSHGCAQHAPDAQQFVPVGQHPSPPGQQFSPLTQHPVPQHCPLLGQHCPVPGQHDSFSLHFGSCQHCPAEHPSFVHGSRSAQFLGVPVHSLFEHSSFSVQPSPSSQGALFGVWTHAPPKQESSVQGSLSSQFSGVPGTHAPPAHVSAPLHASPSLQVIQAQGSTQQGSPQHGSALPQQGFELPQQGSELPQHGLVLPQHGSELPQHEPVQPPGGGHPALAVASRSRESGEAPRRGVGVGSGSTGP